MLSQILSVFTVSSLYRVLFLPPSVNGLFNYHRTLFNPTFPSCLPCRMVPTPYCPSFKSDRISLEASSGCHSYSLSHIILVLPVVLRKEVDRSRKISEGLNILLVLVSLYFSNWDYDFSQNTHSLRVVWWPDPDPFLYFGNGSEDWSMTRLVSEVFLGVICSHPMSHTYERVVDPSFQICYSPSFTVPFSERDSFQDLWTCPVTIKTRHLRKTLEVRGDHSFLDPKSQIKDS